jgi:putative transposase
MIDYPPPGFFAMSQDEPVRFYRRHLPHWRQDGASYFVTFRLGDSLPQHRLQELAEYREAWLRKYEDATEDDWEAYQLEIARRVEKWLDQGYGACVLRDAAVARVVEQAMRHFDGDRYSLFSLVVMPNHVHALVKPHSGHELEEVLQSWKSYTSLKINRMLKSSGSLWQAEGFDRIVRDSGHLRRVVRYIERNPEKIGEECPRWTTPAWDEWLERQEK